MSNQYLPRFGVELAPEVVKADGNVLNLAWRICNAKKVLVSALLFSWGWQLLTRHSPGPLQHVPIQWQVDTSRCQGASVPRIFSIGTIPYQWTTGHNRRDGSRKDSHGCLNVSPQKRKRVLEGYGMVFVFQSLL